MYCIYLAQSFTTSLDVDLRQDISKQRFKEYTRFLNGTFPWIKYLGPCILASVLAKNVTYCTNSTKLDKISVRMARTQPGCVGKFSVVVLILMFTKQKNLNLSAQLLTVLFGRQPICTTANFFSRGGSDRPYFLTFLARTQASMDSIISTRANMVKI